MRKLKLFFACLLMAVLSIGQVWGAGTDAVYTFSTSAGCSALGISYPSNGNYTELSTTGYTVGQITMTVTHGSGTSARVYNSSGTVRLRLYNGNQLTFTAADGYKLNTITFGNSTNNISASVGSISGTTWTAPSNTTSVTFTKSNSGNTQNASITVNYESAGGASEPTLSLDPTSVSVAASDVAQQTISLTASNFSPAVTTVTTGLYSNEGCTSAVTSGAWVKDITVNNAKTQVTFNVDDNAGAARQVWLKITASNGTKSANAILPITQALYVAPPTPASLPFSFTGGRADIATTDGITHDGLGTDYNGVTTKLKFDGTGDNVIINFNAAPGTLSFDIKGNGFSGGTFKVQESANGSTYTDKYTYSEDGNGIEVTLSNTARYVKFVYVSKSSGNIGLGNIAISAYVAPASVATPTISGTESFLTSTTVTLGCTTDGATIYYTIDNSDPKTSGTKQTYSAPFNLTANTTVRAIANKGSDWSNEATPKTFTKITPLTVAEAIALIPNKDDVVNDQYVAGIVCTAAPSLLSGGKLTYYISADGSETNRLQIYKGKNLNNTEFTAVSDLAIGDRVTVFGQLKNFNNTPEMNDGNYLVSKETPAVAAPVFSPDGGGFMGETNVTITCATGSSNIYYTTDGSTTPSKSSTPYTEPIHLNATTTIKAIAYVGEESSLVVTKTFTLTAPMTVAEALAALENDDPINNAAVVGIISTAPASNPSSGKLTYYISDDGADTDELEVYLGFGLNGASFSAKTDLQVGDEVTVFGNLTIFNTTKEFASGSRLLAFNRPEVAVTGIDLTESTAEVEVGKTVTLHASVVPANATNKAIVWSVQSGNAYASVADGVVTGIAEGTAVIRAASDEDATIFAECTVTVTEPAPLSPWATVYTSNVTLSTTGGTSASAAKVKFYGEEGDGYDAIKAGTGSVQGAVVVNVPAGATALHLHAYGWKDEALTLSITAPTGVTVTPSSITLNSNDGITSNSPFTLTEGSTPQTDAYYALTLSGNTAAADLTFTATSGKRFVLFGVNQEGAVTLESISVSGTATALEYNDGDHFNPAGLGVTGHYSDASTAPITEGVVWAFDPDPLTEGTTSVSVTATAGGFTSAAFVVNGLTVSGAAPLSPWATVYTSNIELSGSQNVKVTITVDEEDKNFDGVKMNKAAEATFTIPAGTTNLYAHMAAWNGEAQTVTVSGDCFDADKSIDIVADANISGSGTTYDIDDAKAPTDYFKEIVLDKEVTEPTEITITAASGKRFVLFGVNQVGGIVPVLDHIEISGTMTNTTGWKTGDNIIPEGLTVTAYYTQNDAPHHNTVVTEDVTWSHAALVENQTEVTLTASYIDGVEKTANTNVTIDPVELGDPTITTDPATQATFTATERGAALPAAKTIAVTLKNIASATATLGGTNPDVFSLSKTTGIVDGDVISVSVVSTDIEVAFYSATVTIKDANGDTQKSINIYLTINEPVIVETPVGTFTRWIPATEIKDGMEVLITGVKDEVTYAMGGQNSNNRSAVAASVDGEGVLAPGENTMSFTLVDQGDNTFAIRTSTGKYLYAASSSKNYLRSQANVDDNAKWTLTTTSATANGTNSNKYMKLNSSSDIFSCYGTGQLAIKFYVRKADYTRDVTEGRIGTICLPKAGKMEGASLFQISYMDYEGDGVTPHKIYFDELPSNEMIAGRPYIFLPNEGASKLGVYYTSDETASAGNLNGLYGTLTEMNTANSTGDDLWNNFIFSNNMFYLVNSSTVRLQANRAYVKACDELPGWSNPGYVPSLPAPGLRRIGIGGEAPQVTTGMENVQTDDAQTTKVLINGQFFILRGEKMYDATGRLVK